MYVYNKMDDAADAEQEEEEEEESTATIGPHSSSRSTPLAHLLRRRRQKSPPEEAAATPPPILNYTAPFMSLRTPNHSSIPNSAAATATATAPSNPPPPPPPPPRAFKLSSELSREPLRKAGTVPFAWEQSPGRRKPPSPSPPPPPLPIVTLRELFRDDHHSSRHSFSDPSRSSPGSPTPWLDCGGAPPPDPPGGRPSNASQKASAAAAAAAGMSSAGGADDNDSSHDSYTSAFELDDHMSASAFSSATNSPAAAAAAMDGRLPPQSETGHLLLLHRFLPAAHALACSSSTDHRSPQILTSGRRRAPPPPPLHAMDCGISTDAMDVIPLKTAELDSDSPRPDLIAANRIIDAADNAIDSARYSAAAAAITTTSDDDEDDCAAADRSSCGLFTLMRARGSLTSCAGPSFCSPASHRQSMARSPSSCHSPPRAIASSPLRHRQPGTNQSANRSTSKMVEKPLKLRPEGGGISTMRMRDFLLYDVETAPVSSTINMEAQSLISACSNGSVTRICADSSCCSSQYSDSPRANDEVMNPAIGGAAKDANDGGGSINPDLNHERLSSPPMISASTSTISTDHGYSSSNGGSDGSVISSSSSSSSSSGSSTNYRRIHGATKFGPNNHLMMSPKAAWMESIGSPPLPRSPTQSWLHGSRSTAGIQSRLGRGSRVGEGGSEPSKSDAPMDATWVAMVKGAHVGQPGHLRFSEELHQQPKKIATLEIGG